MRKILIVVLSALMALAACTDEIDGQFPQDQFDSENFFSSARDFELALGGAFFELNNYYFDELLEIGDIPTDNVVLAPRGRNSNQVLFNFNYNSTNDIGLLDVAYEAINISNLILENIETLPEGAARENIRGQALAIRALAHFDMARVYGPIPASPFANPASDLGIPYIAVEDGDTEDPFALPERETIQSNYTEIIRDLEAAADLLEGAADANGGSVNNNITAEAVNGLLSRVYLYNGDYQSVVDAVAGVTTEVAARDELADVLIDESNSGVLLKLGVDQALDAINPGVVWSQGSIADLIPEYVMDYGLYTEIMDSDIRKTVYADTATDDGGQQYNAIVTYFGKLGQNNGEVDSKILRASEVYLNLAEAHFELGNETEALAALNRVREKRYDPMVAGGETGAALEEAIRFERRVELFTQYSRFFDLKRWGLPVDRSGFGDFVDGTGTPSQEDGIEAGSFLFNYPIPVQERQANPNFAQNPGYNDDL